MNSTPTARVDELDAIIEQRIAETIAYNGGDLSRSNALVIVRLDADGHREADWWFTGYLTSRQAREDLYAHLGRVFTDGDHDLDDEILIHLGGNPLPLRVGWSIDDQPVLERR